MNTNKMRGHQSTHALLQEWPDNAPAVGGLQRYLKN